MFDENLNTNAAEEPPIVDPEFNRTGYAIRHDGLGYRAVEKPEDILDDEYFSAETPQEEAPGVAIMRQISELEQQVTPRRMRDAALGTDNGWLADIESEIAALRGRL